MDAEVGLAPTVSPFQRRGCYFTPLRTGNVLDGEVGLEPTLP